MVDNPTYGSPLSLDRNSTPTQQVRQQAEEVGQSAVQAGGDVVSSVKDQTKEVAAEGVRQARDLYGQARSEVSNQASAQKKRAVDGLYALGTEIDKMAEQGGQSGPASQAARQIATGVNQAARWLENREPGHVFDEAKEFARRRPAVFFVGAAVLGVVAGRLTKNLTAASSHDSDGGSAEPSAVDSTSPVMAASPGAAAGGGLSPVVGGTSADVYLGDGAPVTYPADQVGR